MCKPFHYSAAVSDYTEVSISLVFTQLNAEQPQCIIIPITNDNVLDLEIIETFSMELSTNDADVFLSPSSAVISILDIDSTMSYCELMTVYARYTILLCFHPRCHSGLGTAFL